MNLIKNCLVATNYQIYLPAIQMAVKESLMNKIKEVQSEPSKMSLDQEIKRTEAEVLILTADQGIPSTYELIEQIQKTHPAIKIIIIAERPSDILSLIETKASGLVLVSEHFDELIKAIKMVTQGQNYYSPKVKKILTAKFLSQNIFTNQELQILILLKQQEESAVRDQIAKKQCNLKTEKSTHFLRLVCRIIKKRRLFMRSAGALGETT